MIKFPSLLEPVELCMTLCQLTLASCAVTDAFPPCLTVWAD